MHSRGARPAGPARSCGSPGPGLETASIIGSASACGTPVAKALVQIPGQSFLAYTASNGAFSLSHVPAGTHSVLIEAPGRAPVVLSSVSAVSGQQTDTGATNVSDVAIDPNNCGSCGASCSTSHISRVCASGSCEGGICGSGYVDCNANKRTDGCEINVAGDPAHCGGCVGFVCSSNHVTPGCSGGSCQAGLCETNFGDCNNDMRSDGCEIDLMHDPAHCGACVGWTCSNNNITPTCEDRICGGTWTPGFADCNNNKRFDGCEVNILLNVQHCGGCGQPCPSAPHTIPVCNNGACTATCNSGFANCNGGIADGCEIDLRNDPNNCGQCGHVCSAGQACVSSVCT